MCGMGWWLVFYRYLYTSNINRTYLYISLFEWAAGALRWAWDTPKKEKSFCNWWYLGDGSAAVRATVNGMVWSKVNIERFAKALTSKPTQTRNAHTNSVCQTNPITRNWKTIHQLRNMFVSEQKHIESLPFSSLR